MRPATGSIGSAPAPLALQKLKVAPAIVSPNGDGRGDEAKVTYVLSTAATVTAKVSNSLDQPVATVFNGTRAAGKQQLNWTPDAAPDGWYRLTVTAVAGTKQVQISTRFWVDRTLAATQASAQSFSPRLKTLGLSFTLLNSAHVEVRVLHGPQVVATLLAADLGPGSQRLAWNGSKLPDGRYVIEVNATDTLLTVTQSVAVRIDRRAPVLRLVSLRCGHLPRLRAGDACGRRERPLAEAGRQEGGPRAGAASGNRPRADGLRGRPGGQQEPRGQRAPLTQSS